MEGFMGELNKIKTLIRQQRRVGIDGLSLPQYDERRETFRDFVQRLNDFSNAHQLTHEELRRCLPSCLIGEARQAYERLPSDIKTGQWRTLVDALNEAVYTKEKRDLAKNEMLSLKQGGRTVEDFANIVRDKAIRAFPKAEQQETRDQLALLTFIQGLNPKIRQQVRRTQCETFEEAKLAAIAEESVQSLEEDESSSNLSIPNSSLSTLVNAINTLSQKFDKLTTGGQQPQKNFQQRMNYGQGKNSRHHMQNRAHLHSRKFFGKGAKFGQDQHSEQRNELPYENRQQSYAEAGWNNPKWQGGSNRNGKRRFNRQRQFNGPTFSPRSNSETTLEKKFDAPSLDVPTFGNTERQERNAQKQSDQVQAQMPDASWDKLLEALADALKLDDTNVKRFRRELCHLKQHNRPIVEYAELLKNTIDRALQEHQSLNSASNQNLVDPGLDKDSEQVMAINDDSNSVNRVEISIENMNIVNAITEAVLNAANKELRAGGGVDGAIREADGKDRIARDIARLKNLLKMTELQDGQVVHTTANLLKNNGVDYVFHTAAPRIIENTRPTRYQEYVLRMCYYNALALADKLNVTSITMPILGIGIFGYPKDKGRYIAMESTIAYFESNPSGNLKKVVFAIFGQDDAKLVRDIVGLIDNEPLTFAKIDSKNVKEALQLRHFGAMPSVRSLGAFPNNAKFTWLEAADRDGKKRKEMDREIANLMNKYNASSQGNDIRPTPMNQSQQSVQSPQSMPKSDAERRRLSRLRETEERKNERRNIERLRQEIKRKEKAYALNEYRRKKEQTVKGPSQERKLRRNLEYRQKKSLARQIRRSNPEYRAKEYLTKKSRRALQILNQRMAFTQQFFDKNLPKEDREEFLKSLRKNKKKSYLIEAAFDKLVRATAIPKSQQNPQKMISQTLTNEVADNMEINDTENEGAFEQPTQHSIRESLQMARLMRNVMRKNRILAVKPGRGYSMTQHLPIDARLIELCGGWQHNAESGGMRWSHTITSLLVQFFIRKGLMRPSMDAIKAAAFELEAMKIKAEKISEATTNLIKRQIKRMHTQVTKKCLLNLPPKQMIELIIGGFHIHLASADKVILDDDVYSDARELYPVLFENLKEKLSKDMDKTKRSRSSEKDNEEYLRRQKDALKILEDMISDTHTEEIRYEIERQEQNQPQKSTNGAGDIENAERTESAQRSNEIIIEEQEEAMEVDDEEMQKRTAGIVWMRPPNEECKKQIPTFNWAQRLKNVIENATDEGYDNPRKIEEFVKNFNYCKICEDDECDGKERCGKLFDLMKTLEPHYMNIRTLIRIFNSIRNSAKWLQIYREFTTGRIPKLIDLEWLVDDKVMTAEMKKVVGTEINVVYGTSVTEQSMKLKYKRNLEEFNKAINDIEVNECCSCRRLQRNAVMTKRPPTEEEIQIIFGDIEPPEDKELRICRECRTDIKRNHSIPRLCWRNNLALDEVPKELDALQNWLEETFIAQVRTFISIMTLQTRTSSKTGHKGFKGLVSHMEMPIVGTVNKILNTLPSAENTFVVPKLDERDRILAKTYVNIKNVINALKWLRRNNPLYKDVKIANDRRHLKQLMLDVNIEQTQVDDDESSNENGRNSGQMAYLDPNIEESQMELDETSPKDDTNDERADEDRDWNEGGVRHGSPMLTLAGNVDVDHTAAITANAAAVTNAKETYYKLKLLNTKYIPYSLRRLDMLAFPKLFPRGRGGINSKRDRPIARFMYVRSRLMLSDRRFAQCNGWMICMSNLLEQTRILTEVNVWLKKTATIRQLVDGLMDRTSIKEMYSFMTNIKGSPQYWNVRRLELQAMVAHFGAPTFFVTLNPNERNMVELMNTYSIVYNEAITKENIYAWTKKDVPIYSRHNHYRFLAAFQHLFKDNKYHEGIFGQLAHYWYRIEYQQRGAPHCHSLLWIKDAPTLENADEQEVINFIDEYITCRVPDPELEKELYELVMENQQHSCTTYNQNKNKYCLRTFSRGRGIKKQVNSHCRFGYPLPMRKTTVLNKELFDKANPAKKLRTYELKRGADAVRINAYHTALISAWKGNVDIQYIGTLSLAVLEYVTSYVSKGETKSIGFAYDPLIQKMDKTTALKFTTSALRKRDMGMPEVCDREFGHKAYQSSDEVKFLNNESSQNRGRMLIPIDQLNRRKSKNPTREMATAKNFYDNHYPNRPVEMEDICLYTAFCSMNFTYNQPSGEKRGRPKKKQNGDENAAGRENDGETREAGEIATQEIDMLSQDDDSVRADEFIESDPEENFQLPFADDESEDDMSSLNLNLDDEDQINYIADNKDFVANINVENSDSSNSESNDDADLNMDEDEHSPQSLPSRLSKWFEDPERPNSRTDRTENFEEDGREIRFSNFNDQSQARDDGEMMDLLSGQQFESLTNRQRNTELVDLNDGNDPIIDVESQIIQEEEQYPVPDDLLMDPNLEMSDREEDDDNLDIEMIDEQNEEDGNEQQIQRNIDAEDRRRPFYMFPPSTVFRAKDEEGYWKAREKRRVARFFIEDALGIDEKKREERCRRLLFMFKPWRNEKTDLKEPHETYLEAYHTFLEQSSPKAKEEIEQLVGGYQMVLDAMREARSERGKRKKAMEEEDINLDVPNLLAPELTVTMENLEELEMKLNERQQEMYDEFKRRIIARDEHQRELEQETEAISINIAGIDVMVRAPVRDEAFEIDNILYRCMFVSGVAGTGKSLLSQAIKSWIVYHYNNGTIDRAHPPVLVCAPTGLAALNVDGFTIHNLLRIEVEHNETSPYKPLSGDRLSDAQSLFKNCKVLLIDEISMVSNIMLAKMHLRLQEIFCNNKPFGGIFIIAFGDLLQLPPVRLPSAVLPIEARAVERIFKTIPIEINLWQMFDYGELTQNMRQQSDLSYAHLLNRMRINALTEEDVDALLSRTIAVLTDSSGKELDKITNGAVPRRSDMEAAVRFFYHKMKELTENENDPTLIALFSLTDTTREFNKRILELRRDENPAECQILEIVAETKEVYDVMTSKKPYYVRGYRHVDVLNDDMGRKERKVTFLKRDAKEAGGLEHILTLQKGCRIMSIRNNYVNIGAKIVNGSRGTLVDFEYYEGQLKCLLVHFDHHPPGEITKVERVSVFYDTRNMKKRTRLQFPIVLCYAATIHKAQGMTVSHLMTDLYDCFDKGQAYVAASRVRSIEGLYIVNFHPDSVMLDEKLFDVYNQNRVAIGLEPIEPGSKEVHAALSRRFGKRRSGAYKEEFLGLKPMAEITKVHPKGNRSRGRKQKSNVIAPEIDDRMDGASIAVPAPPPQRKRPRAMIDGYILFSNEPWQREKLTYGDGPMDCIWRGGMWRCYANSAMQLLRRSGLFTAMQLLQLQGDVTASLLALLSPRTNDSGIRDVAEFLKFIDEKNRENDPNRRADEEYYGMQADPRELLQHIFSLASDESPIVEQLHCIEKITVVQCKGCGLTRQSGVELDALLSIDLPIDGGLYSIQQLLDRLHLPEDFELPCPGKYWKMDAAIRHIGDSIRTGHYYTYIRHGESWAKHEDAIEPTFVESPEGLDGIYVVALNRLPDVPQPR